MLLLAVCVILLFAGAALFVYSGAYNVAATQHHLAPVYYLVSLTMRQSIKRRAASISAPESFSAARVERGLPLYREHCVECHGAPGVPPNDVAFGLYPQPPNLVDVVRRWTRPEVFWAIKYGVKMTAMPAWHYRLSDEQIWDVVALLEVLPGYSPARYQTMTSSVQAGASPASIAKPDGPGTQAGRYAIDRYLCATCHVIPGIDEAVGTTGPSLRAIGTQSYIAGMLPNTPANMAAWLEHPQRIKPGSAMPELGVTAGDARDIAAYLYTATARN